MPVNPPPPPEAPSLASLLVEGERILTICNACRYCEGHCAVFPAMELRTRFPENDLLYLANLCHNCGSCFHHCQYAPPHEFAVNVPLTLSQLRTHTYRAYAWPRALGRLFDRNGLATALFAGGGLALLCLLALALAGPRGLVEPHRGSGAFYQVLPHDLLIALFGAVWVYAFAAMGIGFRRFWRDGGAPRLGPRQALRALGDVMTLRYLGGGGGQGCTYPREAPSHARRIFHQLTYFGFLLCMASTTVAAFDDNVLGWKAPYPLWSAPVALGIAGGAGLLAGPAGLLWLKSRADRAPNDRAAFPMDVGFSALLLASAATGFLLLAFRSTAAMGALLAVHLGFVLALFAALPYGKFVHAVYRFAALLRAAAERRPAS